MGATAVVRVVAIALVCACAPTQAGTIYVSTLGSDANSGQSWAEAKRTVQGGLNAAAAGDQVWVAAGTYMENITLVLGVQLYGGFAGTETELAERDWSAHVTTLNGGWAGSVVTGPAGATSSTRIDGFTITNGSGTAGLFGGYGGGLYLSSSSPAVANNTIVGNNAYCGGGLYAINSSPAISNNKIADNFCTFGGPGGGGGGLYLESSSGTITGNMIEANSAEDGPGLFLRSSSPAITNNMITGNMGYASASLYLDTSSPTIANNAITGNTGSGLYLNNSSPTVANNTITGNTGIGLCLNNSSPTVANTIVAFNAWGICRMGTTGTPPLRYNCVYGNPACDYSGLTDPTGTDGNMKADPMLASVAYGNCHIQPDSPCINSGSNADVQLGWLDMDGQPRQNGRVDIGADESDGTTWPSRPNMIVRVSPTGDDVNDGSSWTLAKRTVQAGISAAAAARGEVWVSEGTYRDHVSLRPYAHVYGGFTGAETQRNQRNAGAHITILDGGGVSAQDIAPGVSTLDGFTICNSSGNGLRLFSACPMIANNTITGNNDSGLYLDTSFPTIANNTIVANIASSGGGLYLRDSSPIVANNTIAGNSADSGGGVYLCYASSPTITNTIIAFNSSGIFRFDGLGYPTLRYSCVYGNTAYDYFRLSDPTGTNGNIKMDPMLANLAYGDAHIQPGSPCIDTGNDADARPDWVDMDGQPRKQGGHVDIGADESNNTTWPSGPYVIVRVSPTGSDAENGSSWALAKQTVQAAIDAAATMRGEVWASEGTYCENITLRPYVNVYGGFAGTETQQNQRNRAAHVTILDGRQNGSVVTARDIPTGSCTLDGFTIRNGSASQGGGVYMFYAHPRIANNTIAGNSASGGSGGGLYLYHSCPTVTGNAIMDNSASAGGGLYLDASSPTITNNTITGGSAASGGALYLDNYSSPMIAGDTIAGNSASSGGGVYLDFRCTPTIINTIIAFNSSGIYRFDTWSSATLRYNCVYGNTAYDYSNLPQPPSQNGNIKADPTFVRASAPYNLHLLAGSPCINAGDPAFVATLGETDMDGQPRKIGTGVDIGADEYVVAGDINGDNYVNVGDLQLLVAKWGRGPGYAGPEDISGDGYVNVGDLQLLVANWGKSL